MSQVGVPAPARPEEKAEVDVTQLWTISGEGPKALRIAQNESKEFIAPYIRFANVIRREREIQISFSVCILKVSFEKQILIDGLIQGFHEMSVSEIRNQPALGFRLETYVFEGTELVAL